LVNSKSNTLTWSEIVFPIFPLGSGIESFYKEDGVLFAKDTRGYRILDDRNIAGDYLGVRRLHIKADKRSIYPLKRKIDTFIDLVKYSAIYKFYVDFNGKPFKYTKTRYAQLVYKPIQYSKFVEGKGTVFTVKGVNSWFEVDYVIHPDACWVGLLKVDRSWFLYELSFEKKEDTRRKI